MQLKDTEAELEKRNRDPNKLRNHKLSLTCVCVNSSGEYAYTGSKDGSFIKWDLNSRKIVNKVCAIKKQEAEENQSLAKKRHVRHINCIAISSDDKLLATGGWDKQIRIWSATNLSWLHTFTMHRQEVTALKFRQGHPTLYSGSADKSVMLWTLEDDDNRCFIEPLYGHESTVTSLDSLRREKVLSSGGRDQSLRIWKIVEQAQTVFQSKHESVDIARYVDDKVFIAGGEDGAISVWTTMKRSPLYILPKAHSPKEAPGESRNRQQLNFWISALAVHKFATKKQQCGRPTKKRKMNEDVEGDSKDGSGDEDSDNEDEDEEDDDEASADEDAESSAQAGSAALVASGSCDSVLRIWKLIKSGSKYELKPHQTFPCPGFINDLHFTSDGSKVVAACGQEHRFGRWWRLKNSKNCMRVFDVEK